MRRRLREPTSALVRETLEGQLDWGDYLWSDDAGELEISGLGAVVADWREPELAGQHWTGRSLLSNWAPTPIVVDGESFASVESFYHALKYPEGSAERAEVAAMFGPSAQHRSLRHRAPDFEYRGARVLVGSIDHCAILADAIAAKVQQHETVRTALRESGDARFTFPYGDHLKNALARTTPLALMIERAKLRR